MSRCTTEADLTEQAEIHHRARERAFERRPIMKVVQLTQNSPEWLAWRNQGLGASDAPVITGESPYRTPLQLFREKLGLPALADEEDNEFIFAKGHTTEGIIRKQFQDLTGAEMKPLCLVHPKFEYLRASVDGFDPKLGIMEAKLVGQAVLERARTASEIPAHHKTQIQHQLEVSGADVAQWFGHDGKKNGVLVVVRRDEAHIKRMLELEHEFWGRVIAKNAPGLSPRDYLIPDDLSLLSELRDAKEAAENAATYYESMKERVVNTYDHEKIAGAGVKLFRVERSGNINWKSIPEVQALKDEYLEQFRGNGSVSWTIRLEQKRRPIVEEPRRPTAGEGRRPTLGGRKESA